MSERVGHNIGGTEFADDAAAEAYARQCHGIDGKFLLDPFFLPSLVELSNNQDVVDIGCGAAPWSITATNAGANSVFAFDLSGPMVGQAIDATSELPNKPLLGRANAMDIPARDGSFGLALSINVACNLPGLSDERYPVFRHFQEISRVLKDGGWAIFTTPSSLNDTFTTQGCEADAEALETALESISLDDENQMRKVVASYEQILRATVFSSGNKWRLSKSDDEIPLGHPIWRKIPGLVVPNYYHPEEEYQRAIQATGLEIVAIDQPVVESGQINPEEMDLGSQYTKTNAFAVYLLQKTA